MLLIVGGRYGSLASNPNAPEVKIEKYEEEYVSITQKEYQTANNTNIPVIICVDRNVYADYETYLINKGQKSNQIKYAHTDNCKIFEFIDTLQKSAIKLFDKIEDIEHFFSNQISGMLFEYLDKLKRESHEIELKGTLDQIQQVSKLMSNMLNEVASKIFENEKDKYDNLILDQRKSLIDFFITIFKQNCIFQKNNNEITDLDTDVQEVYKIFMNTIFNISKTNEIIKEQGVLIQMIKNGKLVSECTEQMLKLGYEFKITRIEYRDAFAQISDFITDRESELSKYFCKKLQQMIQQKLSSRISFELARKQSIAKNKHIES